VTKPGAIQIPHKHTNAQVILRTDTVNTLDSVYNGPDNDPSQEHNNVVGDENFGSINRMEIITQQEAS
jgi:hypothetical protein